jgi:hypothetical protein
VLERAEAQRALFTKRRKEIYEAIHPETRNGSVGSGRAKVRQLGEAISDRFTADTAKRTRHSERSVQRDAQRGSQVAPDVLETCGAHRVAGRRRARCVRRLDEPPPPAPEREPAGNDRDAIARKFGTRCR